MKKFTIIFLRRLLVHIDHLTLLGNNPQGLCYCENRARVKCGFRVAGCEEVPMCKVPGKVRGRAVLFVVAELLVRFRVIEIGRHLQPPDTFPGL